MNRHKAKCDVLKKIRKGMADKLGVDLHQRECTFEGECKGTCPKCKQEEDILNRALARRAGALALGATASLMLTACAPLGNGGETDGAIAPEIMDVAGNLVPAEEEWPAEANPLMGEPELIPPEEVTAGVPAIQGDIAYEEEGEPAEECEETDDDGECVPITEATLGEIPYDGAD